MPDRHIAFPAPAASDKRPDGVVLAYRPFERSVCTINFSNGLADQLPHRLSSLPGQSVEDFSLRFIEVQLCSFHIHLYTSFCATLSREILNAGTRNWWGMGDVTSTLLFTPSVPGLYLDNRCACNCSNCMKTTEPKIARIGSSKGDRVPAVTFRRYGIGASASWKSGWMALCCVPPAPAWKSFPDRTLPANCGHSRRLVRVGPCGCRGPGAPPMECHCSLEYSRTT